ncbi:hypothetical protein [Hyphomicrobium sp.]|uniref:hypothetical protein n=1 Tax=Hyphomicrobium sp. TaxID=82 RepID=UPI001324CC05|nr:hypothetical protein [Hyphomicrobium sp.]KAB2937406.1 MAG: DUF3800 domain-containing protein [Hyphomicrobium sp.]
MPSPQIAPRFIAYIDEAGDDGLDAVRPIDPDGSNEWLIMGATVIDATHEAASEQWISGIVGSLTKYNLPHLHFRHCNTTNGRHVCEIMADLPIHCFVVASNKRT